MLPRDARLTGDVPPSHENAGFDTWLRHNAVIATTFVAAIAAVIAAGSLSAPQRGQAVVLTKTMPPAAVERSRAESLPIIPVSLKR